MKITFLLPSLGLNGGNRVVSIYAEKLSNMGHQVTLVAPNVRMPSFKEKLSHYLKRPFTPLIHKYDDTFFRNRGYDIRLLETRRAIVTSDLPDADVVIATWWETAKWMADMSHEKGEKFYFVQHNETHITILPIDEVKATYRMDLNFITIAHWLESMLRDEYQVKKERISLIPNSVDLELFNAPPRQKNGNPTIGFLYSDTASKGTEIAIKVCQHLRAENPNLNAICFGSPRSLKYPMPDFIELHRSPAQHSIKDIYKSCDVWLCCSTTEGFGLPVLEAMACRTPVVSTRCGGPEDIITEGRNGFLCPVDDVDALASMVQSIFDMDNAGWTKLSNGAYEHAASFTWDDAARCFESALKHALTVTV